MTAKKSATAEKTERKQGSRFRPGQSGNPNGRPMGSRNKTTIAVEALLNGDAKALTTKAIELAKNGDLQALRICMDRIVPPRRDRPVTFEMPKLETAQDAAAAVSSLLASVAAGDMTPSEASEVSKVIDVYVKAKETGDLIDRLERLERLNAKGGET
ncbi:hypothetical protein IVB34_20325 [Bradyrhizobium sp. 2]|uniref:DUF5681 domain-containing protein n=1 Tax=Bradyrhizobium sp. 2 TaxID=190045 RepID=UPI001FFB5193|nr:DUF5681 domain-containing protein [Bradyrhizobium sp. 2]MCK1460650.1 hypothetical protein [Bradyrhizobium sp. 2]